MARRRSAASRGSRRRPRLKRVGGKRLPARSSSARDAKRDAGLVRLNKYLADNGVASRRGSDELIAAGKVLVDELVVTELGTKIDPATQTVDVDGVRLRSEAAERRYYVLHKPAGVVCTNEARETRPRAIDLVTDPKKGRIFTVGRLDEESKGLLLLTTDGEFAERIAHPRFGVTKTYLVRTQGKITDEAVQRVREGVHLSEGRTAGARILVKRRTASGSSLEVTIQEGRNREVRRVFARVGYKVVSLVRTSIGPLSVRGLKEGHWRALSRDEVEALLRMSRGPGEGQDADDVPEPDRMGDRGAGSDADVRRRKGARSESSYASAFEDDGRSEGSGQRRSSARGSSRSPRRRGGRRRRR